MPSEGQTPGRTLPGSADGRANAWRAASGVVQVAFFLAYPFVVYYAYTRLGTRSLAALLLVLYGVAMALRVRGSAGEIWDLAKQHLGLVLLIGLAVVSDDRTLLLFLPSLASLYMLFIFGRSLRSGPPMIERFARLIEDDLPDFTLPYCRKCTIAWCVFFAANAAGVAVLALFAPLGWWAFYTGLLFYALLGLLLGGEFVMRKLWFRYYMDGVVDRMLAGLFPADRTANGRRSLAYQDRRRRGETSPTGVVAAPAPGTGG